MAPNEILDDFSDGHKPRLTPFQRWVRITSFVAWVTFLAGIFLNIDTWPVVLSPITVVALAVLSILYLFLPTWLFRSQGIYQHLTAHWVGAMMLSFVFGLFFFYQMLPKAKNFSLIAGFGSIAGLFFVLFFMVKNDMDRDERRFWVSMLVRLAIVILLTSRVTIEFMGWYF